MKEYQQDLERFVGVMMPSLDENTRRLFLAALSEYLGHGAIAELSELTGVSRTTINVGRREAVLIPLAPRAKSTIKPSRIKPIRAPGGGRKSIVEINPEIKDMLASLIDGQSSLGAAEPLSWTTRSLRNIQETLQMMGMTVSHTTVASLLSEMGYRYRRHRQGEGDAVSVREREAQFRLINDTAKRFLAVSNPVISIDFLQKKLVTGVDTEEGDDKPVSSEVSNAQPEESAGWRYCGVVIDDATAPYAVNAVRTWWQTAGKASYPNATRLYITAEGEGGMEQNAWKEALKHFSKEEKLEIFVSHFPTGTSKWNSVEHQMSVYFSANAQNSANKAFNVNIGHVSYRKGVVRPNAEDIGLTPVEIPAEGLWNYRI